MSVRTSAAILRANAAEWSGGHRRHAGADKHGRQRGERKWRRIWNRRLRRT